MHAEKMYQPKRYLLINASCFGLNFEEGLFLASFEQIKQVKCQPMEHLLAAKFIYVTYVTLFAKYATTFKLLKIVLLRLLA